jgi:hypothetical protein
VEKTKQYQDRFLALERYLGMSVTTKSHLAEDHSVQQQEDLQGIGDIREDFGERNHQDQAKVDRRLGCVRNFATRETIKSKEEVQVKDEKVQAKIVEIKEKRQRAKNAERQRNKSDWTLEKKSWLRPHQRGKWSH